MNDWDVFAQAGRAPLAALYTQEFRFFMYLPWAAFLLRPFAVLPPALGKELFRACAAALIALVAVRSAAGDRAAAIIAATTGWNAVNLAIPQWESVVLAGALLAQSAAPLLAGCGLALAITKPRALVLTSVYLAVRKLDVKWAVAFLLPTALIALAVTPLAGLDWPVRYLSNLDNYLLRNISLWTFPPAALGLIVLAVIKRKQLNTSIVMALDVALSPLVAAYHLAMFTPIVAQVARKSKVAGLALWALSIAPVLLARLEGAPDAAISHPAWSVGLLAAPVVALVIGGVE